MADGLLNKASIILTPTGYKAGTLYNVAPIDEPYEDFDFARTSTATRINSSGLVSNVATGVPRISYDSNGDNGHILLEPTSTNLITYSEDFSQWALGSNATLTYESDVVAPDGSLGVYRLTLPAQSGTFIYFPISNSNLRTCSVYAKSASINDEGFNILLNIGSSKFSTNNEWQRFEFTDSGSGNVSFINSGDTFVTDIYIWGAQLEELSYATSYIPTLTGSTVTRATETATGAGSADLINSTEGVLYFELSSFYDDANSLSINDGSSSKRITARVRPDISKIQLVVVGSTDDFSYNSATIDLSINNKIAIVYNNGDYYFYVNGVKSSVQSRGTFNANDFTNLDFNRGGGGEPFYGKCKALAVFDEALSDSELTQLTT